MTRLTCLWYVGFVKSRKVSFGDFGSPGPAVSASQYCRYVVLAVSGKNCSQTVAINIAGEHRVGDGTNAGWAGRTSANT